MYLHAHSATRPVAAADLPVLRHFLPAAVLLVPHVLARLVELDVTSTPSSSTLHPRASATTTTAAVNPATTATAAVYPAASTATVDPASTTSIDPASTTSVDPAASTITAATPVK